MKNRSAPLAGRSRSWIVICSIGGLLAMVAAALAGVQLWHGSSRSLPPTPTIDPGLILHPHTAPVTGTLGGAAVQGTLYPDLPGPNTVRLTVHGLEVTSSSPYLTLAATMQGMHMAPITVRLEAQHDTYSGVISLPMFGVYTAELSLSQGAAARHGTARLSLPLTVGR